MVGDTKVSVKIQQNKTDKVYDMVTKESLTLERAPNEPAVLNVSLLRDTISAETGDRISVTLNDTEQIFYGRIKKIDKEEGWENIIAYDQLFHITKNMNWFIYEHQPANKVFYSICDTCRLENADESNMTDTGYIIPYRVERSKSGLDVIQTALDLTYENTGRKFYIYDDFGSPTLSSEQQLASRTKKITGFSFDKHVYTEDGTEHYTAAEAFCETDVTEDELPKTNATPDDEPSGQDQQIQKSSISSIAENLPSTGVGDAGQGDEEEKDPDQEEYEKALKSVIHRYTEYNDEEIEELGFMKYDGTYEEGENGEYKAKQFLKEHSEDERTLKLTRVLGDTEVRGGSPVLVDIFSKDRLEYIRGWFSVEQVTHTIDRGFYTMDLTLKNIIMFDDWNTDEPDMTFKRPESETEEEETDDE